MIHFYNKETLIPEKMKTREAVHMGMDNHEIIILAEVIKYLSLYRTK